MFIIYNVIVARVTRELETLKESYYWTYKILLNIIGHS